MSEVSLRGGTLGTSPPAVAAAARVRGTGGEPEQRRQGVVVASEPRGTDASQAGARARELRDELLEGLRRARLQAGAGRGPEGTRQRLAPEHARRRSLHGEQVDALINDRPPWAGRARAARVQRRIDASRDRSLDSLVDRTRSRRPESAERAREAYRETAAALLPEAEL